MIPKKILIVDDEPDAIEFITYNLKKYGYEVQSALDGIEAFKVLTTYLPDVIITDIMMPYMNGIEFCRKLKNDERLKDVPVFFLSATNDDIHVISAMTSGGAFYISKPIIPEILIDEIESAMTILKGINNK